MSGVHAGVVELDALADPVRPGAQDDHLRPVRRARPRSPRSRRPSSGTAWWPRTRRRRCPPSCRPGARRAGGAASRTASSPARSGRSAAICRSDRPARLALRSRSASSTGASSTSSPQLDQRRRSGPGTTGRSRRSPRAPARRWRPAAAPARRRRAGRRAGSAAPPECSSDVAPAGSGPGPEAGQLGLHRAHRLAQRLGEVAAEAIASPTDFIVVVSAGSAPGNFSNANRGIFTTT